MPSEIKYLALEEHLAISYRSVKLRLESTCDPPSSGGPPVHGGGPRQLSTLLNANSSPTLFAAARDFLCKFFI